jgi:hypothetical protein
MAPQQSALTRFLYEARVPAKDAPGEAIPGDNNGITSDVVVELQPIPRPANSAGSNATRPAEPALSSPSDCIVLNAISMLIGAVDQVLDFQIVDLVIATPIHVVARQWRRTYEHNRHWQDSWAARLPWAESVLGRDGHVTQVRCTVCSKVEGCEKLLAPKIDSLWKHAGRRRALTSIGTVKQGDHHFLTTNQHVRNECIYFSRVGDTIAQRVAQGAIQER